MPRFRKLDGVSNDIGHDLPKAPGIADDLAENRSIDTDDQLDVLFQRRRGQEGHHILDRLRRIERHAAQPHLPGLDLREIENIVDDRQKRVA
ncbi:hypothetical protein D3C86_2058870 [compost metagenome]